MDGAKIAGVDFSGAKDVPNHTWLATGQITGLGIEVAEVKKIGSHALPVELSKNSDLKAIGLDFPFSFPREFIAFIAEKLGKGMIEDWQQLVEGLVFTSFEDYQSIVEEFGREPKRVTDALYKSIALSPLHRGYPSMIQMTYQGMRFLSSLDPAKYSILPFHDSKTDTCAVLEAFPRGTLWALGLPDKGYKSRDKKDGEKVKTVRREILTRLIELREKKGESARAYPRLSVNKALQHQLIESDNALDALLALYATGCWLTAPDLFQDPYSLDNEDVLLEGWIYLPKRIEES